MKLFSRLVLILSTTLSLASVAHAEQTAATPEQMSLALALPNATLIISEVPENQESKVVAELASQSNPDPVLVVTAHDPALAEIPKTAALIEFDGPQAMPIVQSAVAAEKIKTLEPKLKRILEIYKNKRAGVMIALLNSTAYGGAFYYLTSDVMRSGGVFACQFVISMLISAFTHRWLDFTKQNGRALSDAISAIAFQIGKPLSQKTINRWQRRGMAYTAYVLNLMSAVALMSIGGQLKAPGDFLFTMFFALIASSEVIDMHIEERLAPPLFGRAVWTRQIAFTTLEVLSLIGLHHFQIFSGSVTFASIVSWIWQDYVQMSAEKGKKILGKLKHWFVKGPIGAHANCEEKLEHQPMARMAI